MRFDPRAEAKRFSKWLVVHGARLSTMRPSDVVDALYERVEQLGIVVELAEGESGKTVFFCANGVGDLFQPLKEFVEHLPHIPKWTFVALKPGRGFDFINEMNGVVTDASELLFDPMTSPRHPGRLGIVLYASHVLSLSPHKEVIARNILSEGLGEEKVTAVHHIDVKSRQVAPEGALPIGDLSPYIDWHRRMRPN